MNLISINPNQKINPINFLLDGKKTFVKKSQERTKSLKNKILKDIDNKADEIKACIEKIKEIKKFRNEKSIFKQIIIYKVGMDTFE